MQNHLITLQQIRDHGPCKDGWSTLLKALSNPSDLSMQVSIGDIAKSNGAQDALWCTRCIDDRRFVVSLILPAVRRASAFTTDSRVAECIAVLESWLAGDDGVDLRAAARAAAYAASAASAAYAAYAAAYAADDASERERQVVDIIALAPLHAFHENGE